MSMLPSRWLLGSTVFVLCLVLAWQLGQRRGAVIGELAGRTDAIEAAKAAALQQAGEQEQALATVVGERAMLQETVKVLRDELDAVGRLSAADQAELALYRRISDGSFDDSLSIDTVKWSLEDPETLRITLVQARGRDRLAGVMELVLLDKGGLEDRAESVTGERYPLSDAEPPASMSQSFNLRFFETLEFQLNGTIPLAIDVRVVPEGKRHKPFRQRFRPDERVILD